MFSFESVMIFLACSVPIVALFFVLPKIKKKEKKEETKPVKSYEEIKKEEVKAEPQKEEMEKPKEKKIERAFSTNDFSPDDFRGYLDRKQKTITKPTRVDLPEGFIDRTEPYLPRRRRREEEKPKTVAEEIRSLSPELKALIFTGALDKKDYD